MIDGSEKRSRQLAFELENSHVCKKRSKLNKRIAQNKTFCSVFPRGGTPEKSCRGVPPGFPNPDPISDRKTSFSRPVFRPGL